MEHVKKHFLCKYLVRYTVGWGKRLRFQICACFFRNTNIRGARGRQSVKKGENFRRKFGFSGRGRAVSRATTFFFFYSNSPHQGAFYETMWSRFSLRIKKLLKKKWNRVFRKLLPISSENGQHVPDRSSQEILDGAVGRARASQFQTCVTRPIFVPLSSSDMRVCDSSLLQRSLTFSFFQYIYIQYILL